MYIYNLQVFAVCQYVYCYYRFPGFIILYIVAHGKNNALLMQCYIRTFPMDTVHCCCKLAWPAGWLGS